MAYWQRAAPRGGIAPGFGSKGRRDRGTIRGPTATDGLSHRLLAALLRRLGPVASGEEAAAVQKRLRGWAERGTRSLPVWVLLWEAPRGRLGYWSGGIDRSDPADDQGDMAPCSRTLGAIRSAGRFRWRRGTMQVLVGWRAPSGSADVTLKIIGMITPAADVENISSETRQSDRGLEAEIIQSKSHWHGLAEQSECSVLNPSLFQSNRFLLRRKSRI